MGALDMFAASAVCILAVGLLYLAAVLIDKIAGRIERAADERQQREYERQEWEMYVGRDCATLLRAGSDRKDPSQELVRGSANSTDQESGRLLRPAAQNSGGADDVDRR